MKSAEQVARAAFEDLPTADKMLVLDWVELGNSWEDSMISSGVCSGPRDSFRLPPSEARRQAELDRFNEKQIERRLRRLLPDETSYRYETAHHEASHAIVILALDKTLCAVSIDSDDPRGGLCEYQESGVTPHERATIRVAPIAWIEHVYYKEFRDFLPWGPNGIGTDLREARAAVGSDMNFELGKAFRHAKEILNENYDQTVALAEKLDRDGEWRPVRTPRGSYFPVPLSWGGA